MKHAREASGVPTSSMLQVSDMYLFAPHVLLHAAHAANEWIAQSLFTKLIPSTHWLGQVVQLIVFETLLPMHGAPVASRFGGQSFCVVHLAHPESYVLPWAGHTGFCIVL